MTNTLIKPTEEISEEKGLPQGWVECTWEDILDDDKHSMKRGPFGSSLKKEFFVGKGIRVFEQYNPINNDPHWSRYYISEEKYKELEAFTAKAGDLLISCSGTLGKILELPEDVEIGIINQALLKLRLNFKIISNDFFVYLFNAPLMQKKIFDSTTGTAIQNIVGVKELKKITLKLPPPTEQVRIVEKIEELFSNIDAGIEKLEQAKLQIKQYKQSVLKSAFEGKLYKTTEWETLKVKDISENIQYGYTESASKEQIGPRFLRITDIQDNKVKWEEVPFCKINENNLEKYLLKNGDFVFARTGATVGKSYLIKNLKEQSVFASYLIRIRFKDNAIDKYVQYFFQSPIYWSQIIDNQVGVGQPNVNGTRLGNLDIIIPTIEEQQKIVEEIEKRFDVADILEKAVTEGLEKSKQLKQSILKKAFEGRLVPQDPNDEPASILLEKIKAEKVAIESNAKQSKKKTKGGKNA